MSCIFGNLFGWFSKKPNKVENILQFYEENGWYKYPGNKEILEEIFSNYKPGSFSPYCYYNKDMDYIEVYFKDEPFYTKLINSNMNLYISQDTDEIIGVCVLNAKSLIGKT